MLFMAKVVFCNVQKSIFNCHITQVLTLVYIESIQKMRIDDKVHFH